MIVPKAFKKRELVEFIEKEIRLAIEQADFITSGIGRTAVIQSRTYRITDYLEGKAVPPLKDVVY